MYDQEYPVQRYMGCLSLANLFLDCANFAPRRTNNNLITRNIDRENIEIETLQTTINDQHAQGTLVLIEPPL